MGTALTTRLGLGLLLFLALLLPAQISGDNTTTTASVPKTNSSSTSVLTTTLNNTTPSQAHGNSLQSTTAVLILSISLLYVC